jgi:hypothetical protein
MRIKYTYFLTFLFLFSSCGKDKYENNIPPTQVNFDVYPFIDFDKNLTSPSGCVIVGCNHRGKQSCGYKDHGVIVCRMIRSDAYAAYAATCPIDLTKLQIMDNLPLRVKCGKCSKIFDLENHGVSGNARMTEYRIIMSIAGQYFTVTSR